MSATNTRASSALVERVDPDRLAESAMPLIEIPSPSGNETAVAERYAQLLRQTPSKRSVWDFAARLPVGATISLGEGWTPLAPVRGLHPNALVKYEAVNPTASFKDRLNAVSVSMAVQLGYRHVLWTSTGNHGASLAAYAAAAGLECLALSGLCADPASAASVAGLSILRASGVIGSDDVAVCVATGSGLRWSAAFGAADDGEPEVLHATSSGVT